MIAEKKVVDIEIEEYLGDRTCDCGKIHSVDIDKVVIGRNVLKQIPEILSNFNIKKVLLVADVNTFEAAGAKVQQILEDAGFSYGKLVYQRTGDLVPDEKAIGEMVVKVESDTDAILAVGSGVLNDLTKYVSSKLGIPSLVVATAPSMDGYASDTSALILENLKISLPVKLPKAIIADSEVLRKAPMPMILAGLGDMLGKYNALKDWKLANLVLGEYYCPNVVQMVELALHNCMACIDGIGKRDVLAIEKLMEGLVLTGIAMSFVGNSRPASGAEHHLSHFFEMMALLYGKPAALHGTKVGITTLAAAKISELLQKEDPKDIKERPTSFDERRWISDVRRIYGKSAPGIFKLSREGNRNCLEEKAKRRKVILDRWEEVLSILREGPSVGELEDLLKRANAPSHPKDIGVEEDLVFEGIIYAKEIRSRYTVLQLLWDIDLLEEYAHHLRNYYFEEKP